MRLLILLLGIFVVLGGCRPYPRYRTGGNETGRDQSPAERREGAYSNQRESRTPTVELLRFGRIIQSYLGTPHSERSHGSSSMDCSEFTMTIFDEFNGTKLPRTAAKQYKTGYKVGRNNLKFGDLVFFRTTGGGGITHVGIYVGFDEFVHAASSSGIIISRLNNKYWKNRFAGGRRILP